jgi:hypothetical protein
MLGRSLQRVEAVEFLGVDNSKPTCRPFVRTDSTDHQTEGDTHADDSYGSPQGAIDTPTGIALRLPDPLPQPNESADAEQHETDLSKEK